jgi:chemotaxis protein methyltransferase CheR
VFREKYFVKKPNGYFEILPEIRRMVTFSYLNLAEDVYPSLLNNTNATDVILCRNVLMYFSAERAQKAVRNFCRCLVHGGWLVVSQAETSHVLFSQFATTKFAGAPLYVKDSREPHAKIFPRQSADEAVSSPRLSRRPRPQPVEASAPRRAARELSPGKRHLLEVQQNGSGNPYAQVLGNYAQGRYAEAVQKLDDLVVEPCGDGKAIILLARAYANQGKLTEALEWCEKAIIADKLNPTCHYLLATILKEWGRIQDAVASLKSALYLDPNFVLPHFLLGSISCQQRQIQESKRHFRNALSLLQGYGEDEVVPDSEGMTAGRLSQIIRRTDSWEKPA